MDQNSACVWVRLIPDVGGAVMWAGVFKNVSALSLKQSVRSFARCGRQIFIPASLKVCKKKICKQGQEAEILH